MREERTALEKEQNREEAERNKAPPPPEPTTATKEPPKRPIDSTSKTARPTKDASSCIPGEEENELIHPVEIDTSEPEYFTGA